MSGYVLVFSAKKGRRNHKHCSYVIKASEKMFWLNLIHSALNGVILQPRAFILMCSSKDIIRIIKQNKILSTETPHFFSLFHCPFFSLCLNMSCLAILLVLLNSFTFPSNGQYTSVTAAMHPNRAAWSFPMTSQQLKPAFSIYWGLDLSCLL